MLKYHLSIVFCTLLFSLHAVTFAQSMCSYETTGTTIPNTSGTPVVISPVTGTLISANFFDSGAIDPPFRDGEEFVSVCVEAADQNGISRATITTDVGLDNDTRIKGYPQFAVGTKFGHQSETSFRFYSNIGLPSDQRWPVVAENLNDSTSNFQLANLDYISQVRGIGLPAFTNNLPEIMVTLDMDEQNVVGAERDVMLESWFYDTSANAAILGNNLATGQPIVNTLDNIVGIGHRHYSELDNTLLEMMVHIGPLSPNDVSQATRNPGQNQLTERYSGKDYDGDGIDDHFDVDSHVNVANSLEPRPGVYSSGVDANGDGIDDADILPVTIGSFQYSIWYGESFLAPIVIFSRETNSSLQNDFDPSVPDMDLSSEGEITLRWNNFLEYTLNTLGQQLHDAGVSWATGTNNLFTKISASGGAIGGIEFGIEPQINNPDDLPYVAVINKFDVRIDGQPFGLVSVQAPKVSCTVPTGITPSTGTVLLADSTTLSWDNTNCEYWVYAGTAAGNASYEDSRSVGTATSYTFDGYPSDGSEVVVTLWYRSLTGGSWQSTAISYVAPSDDMSCTVPTGITPSTGTVLSTGSTTLSWDNTNCEYWVYAGTAAGNASYEDSGSIGTSTSHTFDGYPADGSDVYVTLWYRPLTGGNWQTTAVSYVAPAELSCTVPINITPSSGTVLSAGGTTLSWDNTNCEYWVYAGTDARDASYEDSGSVGTSTSHTFDGYPADGSDVYVTLWYRPLTGGNWQATAIQYTTN